MFKRLPVAKIACFLCFTFAVAGFIWMLMEMHNHVQHTISKRREKVTKEQYTKNQIKLYKKLYPGKYDNKEDRLELYKKIYPGQFDADYRSHVWSIDKR